MSALAAVALALTTGAGAHAATGTPASTSRAKSPASSSPAALTESQAQVQAKKTGKPVAVSAAESPTSTLTANPGGTFTLQTYAQPVRKLISGTWKPLDATLVKDSNGTISPTLSTTPLTLSGGGTSALATLRSGTDTLSLTLPTTLPIPTLSDDTATYANVLPGVDLVVTVTAQGGFSDVYVIHNAAAAANPKLDNLLSATVQTTGLTVTTDAEGNIQADNIQGQEVFAAPAPTLWDSTTDTTATTAAATRNATTTASATATTGTDNSAALSTVAAPGVHAHQGRLTAHLSGHTLTLTPDPSVLAHADFPVFMDPSWSSGDNGHWATPSANYPTSSYWDKSAESAGLMQVGESVSGFWADTLINFDLPLSELGAEGTSDDIQSAEFYITSDGATNCTAQAADVYAPSSTLTSSNATWNSWFTSSRSLGSAIGGKSFADGWSSSCPAASVGFPLSTGWITSDLSSGKSVQTLALAGASYGAEEYSSAGSGDNEYHVFDAATPNLTITFSHAPAVPTGLTTSPNASTIGNGDVILYAPVSDPDGGTLSVGFDAYVTGHPTEVVASSSDTSPGSTGSPYLTAGSGTSAALLIKQGTLNNDVTSSAYGGSASNTSLSITWDVTVSNGNAAQNATSATDSFTYSTATPGAPDIYTNSALSTTCAGSSGYTVGTATTFYLAPSAGQTTPTSYTYQLNGAEPISAPASGGDATISVTPTAQADILSVNAIAAGSNVGQSRTCTFTAALTGDAAPGDLTGAGNADLLLPGTGTTALPAGLWLAPGTGSGGVSADAANIGTDGTDVNSGETSANSSDYTGNQAITGLFQGSGFNDVLDYNPGVDGTQVCAGEVLDSIGGNLPLNPNVGANALSPVFTYYEGDGIDDTDICATSIANAGNLNDAENGVNVAADSYAAPSFPDLLVVVDGSLYLEPANPSPGNWGYIGGSDPNAASGSTVLSYTNPTGTGSWAGWTITTALIGDLPAIFAIDSATGAVYYYSPTATAELAYNQIGSGSTSYTVTPTKLASSGFSSTTYTNLQAANVGGAPYLWATSPSGVVTTYQINTAGTGLTASTNTTGLACTTHNWALDDKTSGATSTAADTGTPALPLTATAGVTWTTGNLFSPDVTLNGTPGSTTGSLATGATGTANVNAVALTGSFTVSAWVDPTALGGTLLSQDGLDDSGFTVSGTSGGWVFSLNTGSGTAATYDTVTGGSVQLDAWSQVTANYNVSTKVMSLYVDGVLVATGSHTAPATGAALPFQIGDELSAGARTGYLAGQVANVQTWNQALPPPAAPSQASYHYSMTPTRVMDTRSGLGGTTGPVAADSTTALQIAGNSTAGIPATGVTAVALDLTLLSPSGDGFVTVYADGSQQPITSSTNYVTGQTVTNYQIVPVGPDGKIDLYNSTPDGSTAQLIVDVTGYFDTTYNSATAQTYHPLASAVRALNTENGTGTAEGALADGKTISLQVTGANGIPSDATAVALNLTVAGQSNSGFLEAYATGSAPSADTALTYGTIDVASLAGDVPIGTGGTITISNQGGNNASTQVIGDITGYYTTDTTGETYYAVSPTRLVDTRIGIGGSTGALTSDGYYTINTSTVDALTTASNPTLVTNLTVTQGSGDGDMIVYPYNTTQPVSSNINWNTAQTVANLAFTHTGSGQITVYNASTGSVQLVVDCSGFFAGDNVQTPTPPPTHQWQLSEGTGSVIHDTAGTLNGTVSGTGATWNTENGVSGLTFDGTSGYAETNGNALNTAGSYTVSAWVNLTTLPSGNATAVSEFGTDNSPFYLQYNSGSWAFALSSNDTTSPTISGPSGPSNVTAGTWYQIAGVYNASAETAQIYVDGQLVATTTGLVSWNAPGDLNIGRDLYAGSQVDYLPGEISNVETWNTALSAAQVATLN
jgi:hypothetical protein